MRSLISHSIVTDFDEGESSKHSSPSNVRESSAAVFVLIGYPGSGKSETVKTLIGEPVFESEQEIQYISGDFPVTVIDTPGFENMSKFGEIYNSLKDYEMKKVVFGLTIRVGRFESGFTKMLKSIFEVKGIGEHLRQWLRKANDIVQLITSLDLNYIVIQNNLRGIKQTQQANQLIEQMKRILKSSNQEETWCHFHNPKSVNDRYCAKCLIKDESSENIEFVEKLHQELKINICEAVDLVQKLQSKTQSKDKTHTALHKMGSNMTIQDVDELQNRESSAAVFVLIGYPGSGKSETVKTLIGEPVFESEQEIQYISGDFPVTVIDTPGFENMSKFGEIYNSLKDYEMKKVVFGLTIRVGRFESGFTKMLKSIFEVKGIGEHLRRKTFLIFTNVDELKREEEIYHDKFIEWLRKANDIVQLITSLDLNYIVIQNNLRGIKQTQQANQLIEQMKRILKSSNQEETWCHFHNPKSVNDRYCAKCLIKDESSENIEFVEKLHQELKINICEAVDLVQKLQSKTQSKDKTHTALHKMGSNMTIQDVDELQKSLKRSIFSSVCDYIIS
ncbi:unnamed protein product [Mytilus coruscus]|uniref:AIG1-type G domain-containing protein n=1 Tax=Mytilus coruscus TaxID=42192 RepID=A0A6J8AIF4_MYTCO|nr:unnamed protein product [Mytilus coruscus]